MKLPELVDGRDFFKRHFGMCSPAQNEVNRYTFRVAEELSMNPLDVNTAMWVMELDK